MAEKKFEKIVAEFKRNIMVALDADAPSDEAKFGGKVGEAIWDALADIESEYGVELVPGVLAGMGKKEDLILDSVGK